MYRPRLSHVLLFTVLVMLVVAGGALWYQQHLNLTPNHQTAVALPTPTPIPSDPSVVIWHRSLSFSEDPELMGTNDGVIAANRCPNTGGHVTAYAISATNNLSKLPSSFNYCAGGISHGGSLYQVVKQSVESRGQDNALQWSYELPAKTPYVYDLVWGVTGNLYVLVGSDSYFALDVRLIGLSPQGQSILDMPVAASANFPRTHPYIYAYDGGVVVQFAYARLQEVSYITYAGTETDITTNSTSDDPVAVSPEGRLFIELKAKNGCGSDLQMLSPTGETWTSHVPNCAKVEKTLPTAQGGCIVWLNIGPPYTDISFAAFGPRGEQLWEFQRLASESSEQLLFYAGVDTDGHLLILSEYAGDKYAEFTQLFILGSNGRVVYANDHFLPMLFDGQTGYFADRGLQTTVVEKSRVYLLLQTCNPITCSTDPSVLFAISVPIGQIYASLR